MPDRASPGWQRPDKQAAHAAPPFPGSVIELPDSAAFINVLTDSSFIAAAVVAITAGVVRGFSGFGAALIYVPLTASIYTPQVAVASFVLIDYRLHRALCGARHSEVPRARAVSRLRRRVRCWCRSARWRKRR